MGLVQYIFDIAIHADDYMGFIIGQYGSLVYVLLFLIIFIETGIVITPFLPGDSLIFVVGTLASAGAIDVLLLFFILAAAAILGDSLNYFIGNYFGENVFAKSRLFKREYLDKTKDFYKKHGGKTIVLARFIPIVRTFAPFVAGVGKMNYTKFLAFNVVGGMIWVALFLFGGYYFGGIPFVRENLAVFVLIIILASFIPPLFEYARRKFSKK